MRKNLKDWQIEDAQRLSEVLKLTQQADKLMTMQRVSYLCGWSSSAVSQFKNCNIALNLEALLKISSVLGCQPASISPRLSALLDFDHQKESNQPGRKAAPSFSVNRQYHTVIQTSFLQISQNLIETGKLTDDLCLDVISYLHSRLNLKDGQYT